MTDAQKERQENENPIHVEEDKTLEFSWNNKKYNTGFLHADVLRPLASVSSIVDGGNIVLFGPQDSYIENRSTGQKMPMSRRNGVFVMQLQGTAEHGCYEEGEIPRTEHEFGFQEAGVN